MNRPLDIVVFGLSLSSSWGNGHATTWRALIRGLAEDGHRVLFLERDTDWYRPHRDLPEPDFCELEFYDDPAACIAATADRLRAADAVIVGSYVPDGIEVIDRLDRMGLRRLSFYDIDTPVTLDLLAQGDAAFLAPRQIALFDAYFSFSGGPALDTLRDRYGARRALPLYCAVDPDRYRPDPEAAIRWDVGYLGTYSPDRQPTLDALLIEPARRLPDRRFVVAGPQYPGDIDWPANVERIEHLPPDLHRDFYCSQRFTLNVTRDAMRRVGWSPSVRLFEAAACGTPIISDDWPGLTDLLPQDEAIVIADGTEDVVRALTTLDDADLARLGAAARDRVLSGHTGLARARELVAALESLPAEDRTAAASA